MSSGVTPTYFQKYCNYRKFLVYVYALAQSTGPRLYQLIFMDSFAFLSYVLQNLGCLLPWFMGLNMIGRVPSVFEWAPFSVSVIAAAVTAILFFATSVI